MALYRFAAGIVSRGNGYSSTAAAAYRAGVSIVDERTGQEHDYSRRSGVLWSGLYAPKDAPEWANDRSQLWNRTELAEKRKDARVAREFVIALPHELDLEQNRRLVQDFVRENFVRKGFVADVSIHAPSRDGDERNIHAHILVTTRKLAGEQFDLKKDRTQNETATLEAWRESWEKLGNRHLERAGHETTLDRRSYQAQGIERTARIHMGKVAWAMERRGVETVNGSDNRQIENFDQERAKLKAELAELERIYKLEQNQAADEKRHLSGWTEGRAKPQELEAIPFETVSAVERQRREDREAEAAEAKEAERRMASIPHYAREIIGALRSLGRTMGATLENVIVGADRGSLNAQAQVERQAATEAARQRERRDPAPTPQRTDPAPEISVKAEPSPREFVDRSKRSAPNRAMMQELRRNVPAVEPPAPGQTAAVDPLEEARKFQIERMKEIARSLPRPAVSRELEDDELEL